MQKKIMIISLGIFFLGNLFSGPIWARESSSWLKVQGLSSAEVIQSLQTEALELDPSEFEESIEREDTVKQRERKNLEKFLRDLLQLDVKVSLATIKKTEQASKLRKLESELLGVKSLQDAYRQSMFRLNRRLNLIPLQTVVLGNAPLSNFSPSLVEKRITFEMSKQAIEEINGVQLFSKTLSKNQIMIKDVIQTKIEGLANGQLQRQQTLDSNLKPLIHLFGIFDVYPLSPSTVLSREAQSLQINVATSIVESNADVPSYLSRFRQEQLKNLILQSRNFNEKSRAQIQEAITQEKQILIASGIRKNSDALKKDLEAIQYQYDREKSKLKELEEKYYGVFQAYETKRTTEERVDVVDDVVILKKNLRETLSSLMGSLTRKFFNETKTVSFQETDTVQNYAYQGTERKTTSAQADLREVKILGIYPSVGDGTVSYKATLAFKYGFRFQNNTSNTGASTQAVAVDTDIEFAFIPGGCFEMGDVFGDGRRDEKPLQRVCVKDFQLSKYEITQGQWKKMMGDNPSSNKKGDQYPVELVSWNEIQTFLRVLNNRRSPGTGKFCLPTEAQWEYAAREGGKQIRFGNGKNLATDDAINFDATLTSSYSKKGNRRGESLPVGEFAPNGLGLYDMSGNVEEWVRDRKCSYKTHLNQSEERVCDSSRRVIRGGSFRHRANNQRVFYRSSNSAKGRYASLGFRLCRTK